MHGANGSPSPETAPSDASSPSTALSPYAQAIASGGASQRPTTALSVGIPGAALILGCSDQSVRNYVRDGVLHPWSRRTSGSRVEQLFDVREVIALQVSLRGAANPHSIDARVFAAFQQGIPPEAIVSDGIAPAKIVGALFKEFCSMSAATPAAARVWMKTRRAEVAEEERTRAKVAREIAESNRLAREEREARDREDAAE